MSQARSQARGADGADALASTAEPDDIDAQLGRALVAGDATAAPAVWERYAPMVYRFFNRSLGSDEEIEDMTQEVFLRLFRGAANLRDPRTLRSFIYSIATRVLKWQFRRRWVRRVVGLSPTGKVPEPLVGGGTANAHEVLRHFHNALEQLGARERTAFVLRYVEGMSLEETASALGVSLATCKRALRRATDTLTDLVDQDEALAGYVTAHGTDWPKRGREGGA